MNKFTAALLATAFLVGSAPVAIAQAAPAPFSIDNPKKPKDPRHKNGPEENPLDCHPVAVEVHPSGAVHAIEECHGEHYATRMDK